MTKIKDIRVLTVSAMMLALSTILGFLKVPVTELIELRFAYLPIACAGMLFGPAVGGIVGGMSDILGFIVKPTGPYFPGFTVTAAAAGVIYGLFLYGKELTWQRVAIAHFVRTIVVSFLLNPLWLSLLYGYGFWAVVAARLVKTVVMFPIETALLYFILRPAREVSRRP
ncbi:MAG: folate family ECF transporter S component [Stomatobaculum sp.]|nr:folate family ECF transporter S component [Stomatobaculum sp.]